MNAQPSRSALLMFVVLLAFAASVPAEEPMHDMRLTPDTLTWREHPNIPKGGEVTILIGDPMKAGEVVVQRLKLPPHYHRRTSTPSPSTAR
jgi:hypothetical protein